MRTASISIVVLLSWMLSVAQAADGPSPFDPALRAKAIAPFVEAHTLGVVHLDLSRVALQPALASLDSLKAFELADGDRLKAELIGLYESIRKAGFAELYWVVQLDERSEPCFSLVIPVSSGADEKALRKTLDFRDEVGQTVGGCLVFRHSQGRWERRNRALQFHATDRPELVKAFEAAGDTTAQVLLIPSKDIRRALEETMPVLPKQVGGGATKSVTRGLLWAAMGVNAPPAVSLRLVVQSEDAAAAGAMQKQVAAWLDMGSQNARVRELCPGFKDAIAALTPKVADAQLIVELDDKQSAFARAAAELIAAQINLARRAAIKAQSCNNLKQIVLGMLNYESAHATYPPQASVGPDGKPLLSWRVHILPFMEQNELYKQFHLDEAWDSPHNRTLIDKMPAVYRLPLSKIQEKGKTNYLAAVGNGAAFNVGKATPVKDIKDGTSDTMLVLEVDDDHAVTWTKPDDWAYDPKDPLQGIGRFWKDSFQTAFCDGAVHQISFTVDPKKLKLIIEANDGNSIDWSSF